MPLRLRNACSYLAPGLLALAVLAATAAHTASAEPAKPATAIDIADRLELFVDRALIDKLNGAELRLHEPQPMPLAASPLRGSYATVIKDGDLYRAYYRDMRPGYNGPRHSGNPGEITCYAESRDGHEWTFPNLDAVDAVSSRGKNVVLAQAPFCHNFAPFLDTRPGVDPRQRFKALAGHPGQERKATADGLHAFTSADGIHWEKAGTAAVIAYDKTWSHAFDSQNVAFWSEAEARYVCYFRTYKSGNGNLRAISRTTSRDFVSWDKPVATDANLPGEHLYTSQTHPYFRAPHLYVALPTRYTAGRLGEEKTDAMLGATDILFMTWRAGSSAFDRLFTEAFIRPGIAPERWENRANYVAQNVVPTGPAEMSIYHSRSGQRYVLRTDGFVSVRAGAKKGELLTRPLAFSGDKLLVNYSTSAAGSLQVEVQSASGAVIPRFSLKDCSPIVGDEIQRAVVWNGAPSLDALAGKPVRLRFVMTECDLYSIRFQKGSDTDRR
mgnify:FL=1